MAGGIIYLDVDDEITSAAARIRAVEGRPGRGRRCRYGSRVATSRINFRLLSRERLTHDKRLSIVAGDAGDPGARGVGGPAGVRVGGGVRGVARPSAAPRRRSAGATSPSARAGRRRGRSCRGGRRGRRRRGRAVAAPAPRARPSGEHRRDPPSRPPRDDGRTCGRAGDRRRAPAAGAAKPTRGRRRRPARRPPIAPVPPGRRAPEPRRGRRRSRPGSRRALIAVGLAVLAPGAIVGGRRRPTCCCPSATVVVTPREETDRAARPDVVAATDVHRARCRAPASSRPRRVTIPV